MTTSEYDIPFMVSPDAATALFEKIAKNKCAEDARTDAEALLVAVLRFLGCPEKVVAAYVTTQHALVSPLPQGD